MTSRSATVDFDHLLKKNRDEIIRVAKKRGAKNVRIFGSVARRDAVEHSDIDFLVDLEEGRTLLDLGGLLMDLKRLLRCNVDVATPDLLRERIRERALSEAIPL